MSPYLMPVISDHSTIVLVSPRNSISLLFVLFLACSASVAHLQLLGEYGPSTSGYLSRECLSDGGGPISSRKCSYELIHRSQTVIPRAPYHLYEMQFGSMHRCFMESQMVWRRVFVSPCVALARPFSAELSFMRHPQLRVPRLSVLMATKRSCDETITVFPQEQRQFQCAPFCLPIGSSPAYETIVSRPTDWSVRFRNRLCVGRVMPVMANPFTEGGCGSAA